MNKLPVRNFTEEERSRWNAGLFDIYNRMRQRAEGGPYEQEMGGLKFTVLPNVYAPTSFTDTLWFAERVRDLVQDKSLLEIGTGTGAIAIFAAKNGARVVATDINPAAVANARANAEKLHLDISIHEGDMYKPLAGDEKFDFIFWAHPFNNWDTPVTDPLLISGMDYRYQALRAYVEGAAKHLTNGGRLLLGTGDTADLETIAAIAKENRYILKLIDQVTMPLEAGGEAVITDLLYEFVPEND